MKKNIAFVGVVVSVAMGAASFLLYFWMIGVV